MSSKKGWIRIVEAAFAILLIAGVFLILLNKGYIKTEDISKKVSETEISVLREIELNSSLRSKIIQTDVSTNPENVPQEIEDIIQKRMPSYLECKSKICELNNKICTRSDLPLDKDVYVESVAIATDSEQYNPRQLRIFCWTV